MLELIFQGFMEWAYGLALECWEYFSSSLLSIMSMDYAYMKSHVPVMVSIAQVLLAVGWALLIGNLVFQALKSMAVGLGFEGEDPKLLFTRTFVFAFLLMASPQICEVGLSLTARIIELLEIPDAINVTLVDEGVFGSLGAAWLLVIIFGLIIMFKVFRLLLEIAERYVILAVLTMTAPLAFAMGGSKSTSEIFGGWCRMFGSMCTLMVTNVIFFKMLLSVLSNVPSGLDIIPWIVLVLTIVKVARKADAMQIPAVPQSTRSQKTYYPNCLAVRLTFMPHRAHSFSPRKEMLSMPRLSKFLEKLEDRIANRCGRWYERNKARAPLYAVLGGVGWYFYGMLLNSLKLGRESVFNTTGEEVESIWVLNPFRNLFVVLTPFGLGVSAFIALMVCLITKKGYSWFSGYKFTRDARGFDILPDGTHGTSGFATKKELAEHLELGSAEEVTGMLLGRIKARPDDPEKYATYVAHRMKPGENNNILCIGAPGSYKSRGFIIPFLMGCAQRSSGGHPESVIVTDPKGELFENLAPYFREHGFYVKAVNFLDMAHSDGWNCLAGLEANPDLVTTVANTIIQNTSGPKEADDFWSRAELNLLMALIHYVCNLKDARGNLLPLEQRSLGDVYKILAYKSVNEINRILAELPPEHPAKGPHGLFLKARENLWGNIIIGLGNRLAVFQNPLVDKITRNHDVDLLLPGQKPCAYFVIISAQDSAYRFLSSLFFSLTFPQLSNYARLHGGRLPVLTNFCLEEYLNIGYMEGISDVFNSIRGFNMSVQVAVQSLSQWQEKYPGKEWENQLGSFDMTLYMGCNDMTSAEYFAKKCGKVTISVTNNQFPLAPLFSPIYSTTRPYSQTRSNTQRDLLQPDEFLRLNKFLCIVMFNHYKPAQLYKIMLEELPEYKKLKKCSVFDYVPEWKKREEEGAKHRTAGNRTSAAARNTSSAPPASQPSPASGKRPDMQPQISPVEEAATSGSSCGNDSMTPEEIGLVEMTCEAILEGDDTELEEMDDPTRIPPGRGI